MSVVLVDDHVLGRLLRGDRVRAVARHDVATTGLWYLRLCQAVERSLGGMLSAPFAQLDPARRARAIERVLELPDDIALLSLRSLAPTMARQQVSFPKLNLLGRETLAAATQLPSDVLVAENNIGPRLAKALAETGHKVRTAR